MRAPETVFGRNYNPLGLDLLQITVPGDITVWRLSQQSPPWFTGTTNPTSNVPNVTQINGDLYLNTSSGTVWQLQNGTWTEIAFGSTVTGAANLVYATPNGSSGAATLRSIVPNDLTNAIFQASGSGHSIGAVPDPGSTAGSTRFLNENGTFVNPQTTILPYVSVANFGTTGNCQMVTDAHITNTSFTVTSASGLFKPGDVGKVCYGAWSGTNTSILTGAAATATIATYVDANTVTMSISARFTETSGVTFYWGTDDTAAIQSAMASIGFTRGSLFFPPGGYLISGQIATPSNTQISVVGSGRGVTTLFQSPLLPLVPAGSMIDFVGGEYGDFTIQGDNTGHGQTNVNLAAINGTYVYRINSSGWIPDSFGSASTDGNVSFSLDSQNSVVQDISSQNLAEYDIEFQGSTTTFLNLSLNSKMLIGASKVTFIGCSMLDLSDNGTPGPLSSSHILSCEINTIELTQTGGSVTIDSSLLINSSGNVTCITIASGAEVSLDNCTLQANGTGHCINNSGTFVDGGGNLLSGGAGNFTGSGTFEAPFVVTPTFPTSASSDNSTKGATTAFVKANIPTVRMKQGSGAGNYTTTSQTFVDVDATNLALTITIPVGFVLIIAVSGYGTTQTSINAGPVIALFDSVAGTQVVYTAFVPQANGAATPFSLNYVIVGDGASHTVKLQYESEAVGDTAEIYNASAIGTPTMVFTLTPTN